MYATAIMDTIKHDISNGFSTMEPTFWQDVSESIYKEFSSVVAEMGDILAKAFNSDSGEKQDFIENFKYYVKKETKSYVGERAKMLPDDILRKFKKVFERDE